tara:strand:- start:40 stop:459 length:420 start_codon:yes stop_codon:yes gene_type:complete
LIRLGRKKLYLILLLLSIVGYFWVYFNLTHSLPANKSIEVCFYKHITNMPCPSCGATRSVILLSEGDFTAALLLNPIGYIIAFIMLIIPVWIIIDLVKRGKSLFDFLKKTEAYLERSRISKILIFLLIINWIWNITKGL